jgi:hypothetical protein
MCLQDMQNIGTFIRATVVELGATSAKLSDGQEVKFEYAAICTGSSYSNSINKGTVQGAEERLKQLKVRQGSRDCSYQGPLAAMSSAAQAGCSC